MQIADKGIQETYPQSTGFILLHSFVCKKPGLERTRNASRAFL